MKTSPLSLIRRGDWGEVYTVLYLNENRCRIMKSRFHIEGDVAVKRDGGEVYTVLYLNENRCRIMKSRFHIEGDVAVLRLYMGFGYWLKSSVLSSDSS